jgi:hypothetical protein
MSQAKPHLGDGQQDRSHSPELVTQSYDTAPASPHNSGHRAPRSSRFSPEYCLSFLALAISPIGVPLSKRAYPAPELSRRITGAKNRR